MDNSVSKRLRYAREKTKKQCIKDRILDDLDRSVHDTKYMIVVKTLKIKCGFLKRGDYIRFLTH